jgi:hypothetical protein
VQYSWKNSIETKMHKLEAVLEHLVNFVQMPESQIPSREGGVSLTSCRHAETGALRGHEPEQNEGEIIIDLESGPSDIPGFHISRTPTSNAPKEDLITREIIPFDRANAYFGAYQNRLDHFLYRILGEYSAASVAHIREASPLLTSAICTVGALHLASSDFDRCYAEFVSQSASISFSKKYTIDDVRALIIGAFWLPDLSWALVGTAVRMATELQLHKSFTKALNGDRKHYLRTRLYLLIYSCDHHFSIPYGRPPMTREDDLIRNARLFLDCSYASEYDARLVSQVLRWSKLSNIFDTFGVDIDRMLSDEEIRKVKKFNFELDTLWMEWTERFKPNQHVGNYPSKGVDLQYHFGKLYLCSHVFRNVSLGTPHSHDHSTVIIRREIGQCAVHSALAILQTVEADIEIQSFLNGLSVYFHTMIAFAAVFLLKVSTSFSGLVELDTTETQQSLETLNLVLKDVTSSMHPRHILVSIAKGIHSLLQRSNLAKNTSSRESSARLPSPQIQPELESPNADLNWWMDPELSFMGEFDFLGQNPGVSLELSSP